MICHSWVINRLRIKNLVGEHIFHKIIILFLYSTLILSLQPCFRRIIYFEIVGKCDFHFMFYVIMYCAWFYTNKRVFKKL